MLVLINSPFHTYLFIYLFIEIAMFLLTKTSLGLHKTVSCNHLIVVALIFPQLESSYFNEKYDVD